MVCGSSAGTTPCMAQRMASTCDRPREYLRHFLAWDAAKLDGCFGLAATERDTVCLTHAPCSRVRHGVALMTLVRIVNAPGLLMRVQMAIVGSQRELGLVVGVSRRTVSRWMGGQSGPSIPQWATLARATYRVDPALARTIASEMGETLVTLGIEAPADPQPAAPA